MAEKQPRPRFSSELRARGVRMVCEQRANYSSDNAAYASISEKLGCTRQTLRAWCIQAERDADERPWPRPTADKE